MQREIFLEENKSKLSVNSESNIAVNLTGKHRLLPFDSAAETMSLYELYNRQRDNCEKYRLIFNINPFCTNALFNSVTEPVWREGSDSATSLVYQSVQASNTDIFPNGTLNKTEDIDRFQAIKDTEYSHPEIGGIVYHCGYDIFNNHLLRTEDFLHVQQSNENTDNVWEKFNTIEDYMVDNEGDIVMERGGRSFRHLGKIKRHMYQYDNCTDMVMAYLTKISEENGWYGFINTGYINIPNGKLPKGTEDEVCINRIMNGNKPCEFYDMYPDRSLFSFIPKVNKWRRRLEKNWDYCITYPYKSDEPKFNELNDTPNIPDSDRRLNALKIIKTELKYTNSGDKLIRFKTLFDHGLSKGSYVRFYYIATSGKLTRYFMKVRVQQVGDYEGYDSNKYFSVSYNDVAEFIKIVKDGNTDIVVPIEVFVRQEKNGCEFNYYLRKFKKIKYNDSVPRSEINKTAYQETIYGDRAAQIVYTDDIDVANLVDNLGRPLTNLYLTIVKTNRGHNEWYLNRETKTENIEFSHCFGKVTSGFDFGNDALDYNIRKMHNIEGVDSDTAEMLGWVASSGLPQVLENDITVDGGSVEANSGETDGDEFFYGDVACYDTYNLVEHIIMPIYHRFNTMQRELVGDDFYRDIMSDEIYGDDFDYEGWGTNDTESGGTIPEPEPEKTPYNISTRLSATTMLSQTKCSIPSNGSDLKGYIVVTSSPTGHVGNLTLNNEYTGIHMEKTGDVYTVYFNENNTESARTVTIEGVLYTPTDVDYSGGTTSTTVYYTFEQQAKEFPYGYELILEAEPLILEYQQNGSAKATVRKVTYFEEGREGEENVRSREIINVENDEITWGTIFPSWFPSPEDVRGASKDVIMPWQPSSPDSMIYTNNNYTVIPEGEDEEPNPVDITDIKITAEFLRDGKSASGTVEGILLKAQIPDEEPAVYTYELKVTPQTATATTLSPAQFTATLYKTKSGSTMPEPPEGTDVTRVATWELEGLDGYARIDNGGVINLGVAENEMPGTVRAKVIDGNGEEQEGTAQVTITPNLNDQFQIFVVDDHVITASQVTISVTSKSDTNGRYNTTKSTTANTENPAVFEFEKGNTTLTYKVQVTRCDGDGSSRASYSLYEGELETYPYTQLNSLISNTYYEFGSINGSAFKFTGAKNHITLDTTESQGNFGSIQLQLKEEGISESLVSVSTSDITTVQSNEFWVSDVYTAQTGISADYYEVEMSGGILEGERYKNYSLCIKNSNGMILVNSNIADLPFFEGTHKVLVPRNGFFGSVWYLQRNQSTFSLEVKSSTDVYTVEYSGTLQYEAWLIETDGENVQRTDVTSAMSQDLTIKTEWSLTGDARAYASIVMTGASGGLVTNRNETDLAKSGKVVARYRDTNRGIDIYSDTSVTLSQKIEIAYNVRVRVPGRVDEGVQEYMNVYSTPGDMFRSFVMNVDSSFNVKNPYMQPGNYLIGGNNEHRTIDEIFPQSVEELQGKTVVFKWEANDDRLVDRSMLSEIGLYIRTTDGTVTTFLGTLDAGVSPSISFGSYAANIAVREDLKNMDVDFQHIIIAPTGSTVFGMRSMKMSKGILLGASGGQKATEFATGMLNDPDEGIFSISSVTLNRVDGDGNVFYGNINPEGYFYQPHTQIRIRQLSENIQSVDGVVINFNSAYISTAPEEVETYNPETNETISGVTVYTLSATSPTNMDFVEGMEFIFYNKETGDGTKMGRLLDYDDKFDGGGCLLSLWVNVNEQDEIDKIADGLRGGDYLLVLKKEYAPRYAIFQPKLRQFIWRDVVPQSELRYDDDLYDMTFANGRFYIHTNMNFYLRRQDPQNIFGLQSPETQKYNPLKKFRIIGRDKVDTSGAIYSIDNLIDCF